MKWEKAALKWLHPYPRSIFYKLPTDMIVNIFTFLDDDEKALFQWAAPIFAKQMYLACQFTPPPQSFTLSQAYEQNPSLKKKELVAKILKLEHLVSLDLIGNKEELLHEYLGMGIAKFSPNEVKQILIEHPRLRELKIFFQRSNPDCIDPIADFGKNLRVLYLRNCEDESTGNTVLAPYHIDLLTSSLPLLNDLTLAAWKIDWSLSAIHLSRLKELRSLKLTDASQFGRAGLSILSQLKYLETLQLSSSLLQDQDLLPLRQMTQLKNLDLSDLSITDEGLLNTISHLTQLTSLRLDSEGPITDIGYSSLASLTALEHLDLSYSNLTDTTLANFSSLRNLKILNISMCFGITAAGCEALRAQIPGLVIDADLI